VANTNNTRASGSKTSPTLPSFLVPNATPHSLHFSLGNSVNRCRLLRTVNQKLATLSTLATGIERNETEVRVCTTFGCDTSERGHLGTTLDYHRGSLTWKHGIEIEAKIKAEIEIERSIWIWNYI
jgi:hypothetical protein